MRLQYLGTAAAEGWPAIFCACDACKRAEKAGGKDIRRRSGALINDTILLDFSPDLYFAKISLGLDLSRVHHVVITHAHSDHLYAENLEMYLPGYAYTTEKQELHLYGSAFTLRTCKENFNIKDVDLSSHIIFHELTPFVPFEIEGIRFTPLKANHGCPDSLIYMIQDGSEEWLYAHDTGIWSEESWQCMNSHHFSFILLDCTNGPLKSVYEGHMGFDRNLIVRDRMMKEGMMDQNTRVILNHFSHNGKMLQEEMEKEMNPKGFEIAYDGLTVQGK